MRTHIDDAKYRSIAPTINNPQSSRSHIIASIQCHGPNPNSSTTGDIALGTLYVGDFAGVENDFGCDKDPNIIVKMLNIQKDGKFFYRYRYPLSDTKKKDGVS